MAQQMADLKFSGHGLPNNETGLANQDKQPTLLVTAKKIPLRDLQNEIRITGPTSMESFLFRKESGPLIEASKSCGTKRPAPECLVSPPHLQSPTTNAANGHLVYVRRRPDLELAKSSISYNTSNITDVPQGERNLHGCDETTEQKSDVKEPKQMHSQHWEERYFHLQDLLKALDQSNQQDCLQRLRSLSSLELSRYAFELEKKSIQLSLEEAKEIQRVQLFDVLGKYTKISRAPFA